MYIAGVFVLLAMAVAANLIGGKAGIGGARPETWGITLALFAAALVVAGVAVRSRWDGIFIDRDNRISLSRFQLVLWTIILVSALLTAGLTNALAPPDPEPLKIFIPKEVWGLLGLGAFTAVAAPAIKDGKRNSGGASPRPAPAASTTKLMQDQKLSAAPQFDNRVLVKAESRDARWIDLIMGDFEGAAYVDVSKLQQLTITLVLVVIYTMALFGVMAGTGAIHDFPKVDPGFLALLAISHAAYLADKQIAAT